VETTVNIIIVADTRVFVTCPRRKFSPARIVSRDSPVIPRIETPNLGISHKTNPLAGNLQISDFPSERVGHPIEELDQQQV
jgi:hypothetical protein